MTGFGEIYQNDRFGAKMFYFLQFWRQNGTNIIFWGKNENITSVRLLCCNFVQETRTKI